MLEQLLHFIKKPEYKSDNELGSQGRWLMLGSLLAMALFISLGIAMIISVLEQTANLDFGEHAIDQLFQEYGAPIIFIGVVILAPILEELIFRGPLYLFRNSPYFGIIFYLFTLAFGFYHITNFELTPTVLYLSPLLVAPQLIIGLLLGYIRIRLGLIWAMMLHSCYNLVLIGPLITMKILNMEIP
ncbi:MAG: CPBP family intramembrane glutamic endopeptidase [Flavobacteriaceae bacterium]